MLKRELMKIALCAAGGVLLALLLQVPRHIPSGILYVIGVVYSARIFLPKLWEMIRLWLSTITRSFSSNDPLLGILFGGLICGVAIIAIVVIAWIVGVIMAIISLCRAAAEDRQIRGDFRARGEKTASEPDEDSWGKGLPAESTSWDSTWD